MTFFQNKAARNKIALIGAGNIGGTIAHLIALKQLADVVLFDIDKDLAAGKILDIAQSAPLEGFDIRLEAANDYKDISGSNVIIVSAGFSRKPGMSRDDLLLKNAAIIAEIAEGIRVNAPDAFVIVITNPLDVMVAELQEKSGLSSHKVVGMAGVLDSARLRLFLAQELGVSVQDVNAFVMGSHGDNMIPMIRYASIGGISISDFIKAKGISKKRIDQIIQRTANGGGEIIALLKNGSAYYAPASSAVLMAESYLKDKKRLLSCSAKLEGEYGVKDLYVGVPVIIGKAGIEKIIEVELNEKEQQLFQESCGNIRALREQFIQLLAGKKAV